MAATCARTGRVVINRTATNKCLATFQSTRNLFVHSSAVSYSLVPWPPAGCHAPLTSRFMSTTDAAQLHAEEEFRDRYIPMTRKTLIQNLLQEPIFLTEEEKKSFETFSLALDGVIINRHKGLLTELKSLFDPINPDLDTKESRAYNRRERLDYEFWLLQKLSTIMEKANFHEVPRAIVEDVLKEHNVGGVTVSVNPEKYDLLRYWVVGKTPVPRLRDPWYRAILKKLKVDSTANSAHYFKRVVVAVRLKKDDHLFLKAFKEVPVDRLDHILPAGSVRMTKLDQRLLLLTGAVGLGGVLGKAVAELLHVQANWTLLLVAASGAGAARLWTSFKNRQQQHLVDLSKTLYFKNIINNRGLLTLLLDKAEDEVFKEALLVYTFLLASRPPSAREKDSEEQIAEELGSMPSTLLQQKVVDWIHFKTGALVQFDPAEGVELLQDLGLLTKDAEDNLHVLPLKLAMRNLPQRVLTLIRRIEEYDLIEGFEVERGILEEKEEEYTLVDKLRRRIGWF